MGWIQKIFTSVLPASWAKSMEADSRLWFMQCGKCSLEQSIWDLGGIRWKAKGESRNLKKCLACGEQTWHKTYRKEENK